MRSLNQFTRKYKLAKTLRFELRPIGKTLETFNEKFLAGDERRAQAYPRVKEILDEEHKALLERVLANAPKLDWDALAQAHEDYRSDKSDESKDNLAMKQTDFRKKLVALFKDDELFKLLTAPTPQKLFKAIQERFSSAKQSLPPELNTFMKFSSYFKGYQENRNNIYAEEEQTTATAYRAINVNFTKFLENIRIIKHISQKYPAILIDAQK